MRSGKWRRGDLERARGANRGNHEEASVGPGRERGGGEEEMCTEVRDFAELVEEILRDRQVDE